MSRSIAGIVALGLAGLQAAEAAFWQEDFDRMPAGVVTNQPGWEMLLDPSNTAPCSVNATAPHSPPHALYVAPIPSFGATKRMALYTGAGHRHLGTNEYLVRVSARILRANSGQYLSLHLGAGSTSRLSIATSLAGTVVVGGIDTGVPFVTGRYARVILWYNMSSDQVCAEYDGATILPWTSYGAAFTLFNQVWVQRGRIGASDSGAIYVDDLSVETIPPETWGWWRFEEGVGTNVSDHAGHFDPRPLVSPPAHPWPPETLWNSLLAGDVVVANQRSVSGARVYGILGRSAMPATSNWTAETFFYYGPQATNRFPFLYLYQLASTNDSSIRIEKTFHGGIWAFLRDRDGAAETFMNIAPATTDPDSRWHHLALVKSNLHLRLYLDYDQLNMVVIGADGDGLYEFEPPYVCYLGGGIISMDEIPDDTLVDEFRFSRVALSPDRFLRADAPRLVGIQILSSGEDSNVSLQIAATPHRYYRMDYSYDGSAWSPLTLWQQSDFVDWEYMAAFANTPRVLLRIHDEGLAPP